MSELKRCPFCGGEAKLTKFKPFNEYEFFVECMNVSCAVIPKTWIYKTETEAIVAWNNRVDEEE